MKARSDASQAPRSIKSSSPQNETQPDSSSDSVVPLASASSDGGVGTLSPIAPEAYDRGTIEHNVEDDHAQAHDGRVIPLMPLGATRVT